MQTNNAIRRIFIATIMLGLVACGAPVRIGDMSQPLMPPGHGLVATTVVFSNPTQPSFMKPNSFLFNFEFEATDGQSDSMSLALNGNDPSFVSKNPRAMADDTPPVLLLKAVKPGKYRLKRAAIIEEGQFNLWPTNSREIEVVAGQVTYIGSMLMKYESSFKGTGVRTPRYFVMSVVDDFDRDMSELKSLDKRLESLVVTNGVRK